VEAGLPDQHHPVQAGFLDAPDKTLGEGIQIRGTCRQSHRFHPSRLKDHSERLAEHAGPIMNEITAAAQKPVDAIGQVPGDLLHPRPIGLRDDAGNMHLPRGQSSHEENVVADQTQSRPHFHTEEVGRGQHVPVGAQEFLPRCFFLTLRSGIYPRLLQYFGNRPTTDLMAQILERPLDACVAPGAVFRRHAQDQSAQLDRGGRAPWRALASPIVFARDEPLMPIQESAWGAQSGNSFEVFETDVLGLGRQPSPLCIVESGFLAQLFVEDFHLFLEVLDQVLLVAVDPTGQAYHKELKSIHLCIL